MKWRRAVSGRAAFEATQPRLWTGASRASPNTRWRSTRTSAPDSRRGSIPRPWIGKGITTMLVAFPRTGEIVSVQIYGSDLGIKTLVEDLLGRGSRAVGRAPA